MRYPKGTMVSKMKVAVVGLGVEGVYAVKSLLHHNYMVYASDINENIELDVNPSLDVDLGYHDFDKIQDADAVVLSPSLWDHEIFLNIISNDKLLSDVLTAHRSIYTIGITGTNGKTTTTLMIRDILQKSGLKVLVGGNAGGGFQGYTEIILQAEEEEYDILLVEVCDMTLDFCTRNFDFDLVVVTNMGMDHMEVHQSMENYLKSMAKFVKGKQLILNQEEEFVETLDKEAEKTILFGKIPLKLNLYGKFNLKNAAAAATVAEILGISDKDIKESLESFKGVPGRTTVLNLPDSRIVIGKTDNSDAIAAVLAEESFNVIILGTPRQKETCRYDILIEVSKTETSIVALFPGLEDTVNFARAFLEAKGFQGEIISLKGVEEVIEFTKKCINKYDKIFIGGNGQKKIIEITDKLKENVIKHY
jgi:UDP-N-acetylmuramoylalanine--D-glutamate ligase